jgi:multidrug resistance protein MdtO
MAATATTRTRPDDYFAWVGEFLENELQPYPGRAVAASRMVVAATLTMIVIMTFRIHGGGLGTLYAFFIARDNIHATLRSAASIFVSYAAGVCFILVGANLFADDPTVRVLWFSGSIFIVFFFIKTLANFEAAIAFALLVVNTLPTWQLLITAEVRVERTLSQALAVGVGTLVTVAVELVFHALHPKEELFEGLEARWNSLRSLLHCYARELPVPEATVTQFAHFATIGSSRLRRILSSSSYERQYREQMTAVVALTGRMMDIGSTMAQMRYHLAKDDPDRIARVLIQLDEIQKAVETRAAPPVHELECVTISGIPLLHEIVQTVNLIPRIYSGDVSSDVYIPSSLNVNLSPSVFVVDAFSNPDYVKFALRGCLAATLCYLIYTISNWRGLSTSIAACALTALSNVGASRQRQILRFTGGATGGFIFGIGSQAFILPHFDTLSQFVLLFAAVTAVAAWFATSSPRLSYFGVQMAQAFYFINVEEFTIQTSLTVARNRVLGIMLGLIVMWIVFDRIWAKPAAQEMIDVFTANLRLIAELAGASPAGDPKAYVSRIRSLRRKIADNFQKVNAQADAIPFEFGIKRAQHMVVRSFIRRWQPSLRTLYFIELALMQHRIFGAEAELPASVLEPQHRFNQACAQILGGMADRIEGKTVMVPDGELVDALHALEACLATSGPALSGITLARVHGLITLSQEISSLVRDSFEDVMKSPRNGMLSLAS